MDQAANGALKSMTGMAVWTEAMAAGRQAQWELRSVNSRGLDLRLRIPEGLGALELGLRKLLSEKVKRGALTLSLRLTRSEDRPSLGLDPAGLAAALEALSAVHDAAEAKGIALRPATAADVLSIRGVMALQGADEGEAARGEAFEAALLGQAASLVEAFEASRLREGAALAKVLRGQLAEIEALVAQARALVPERREAQAQALSGALERLKGAAVPFDPERLEQELALIATRGDVTEELDRLATHLESADRLLREGGPVGRPLDFLVQEFNREANTLCSKSQHAGLTRIGLDLKSVIDQMREQIQNIE